MPPMDARWIARVLLIGLAWCLWPAPAQAQAYLCGNGPGPGERMVGMTQGGQGVASMPLCARDGPAPPPPPPVVTYAAIAWHADASDIWVDGNYNGPNAAERGALAMCNQAMGGGCTSTGEWSNSSMIVLRDRGGDFSNIWGGRNSADRRQAIDGCTAKQLLPCEVFATIRSTTNKRAPGAGVRKLYAASAWAESAGYDHKLYVASGLPSLDAATAAAIKACREATAHPCVSNAWSGNGFIQAYRLNGSDESATAETSATRAEDAAKLNCKRHNSPNCEIQARFDARRPGVFVHNFIAASGSREGSAK